MYSYKTIKRRIRKKIFQIEGKFELQNRKLSIWFNNNLNKRKIVESKGKMFWWYDKNVSNFGDIIGPYLFEKITGYEPVYSEPNNRSCESVYMTVGSIMNFARINSIIWGSGIISKHDLFPKPLKTCAVRGPYTRRRFLELGYSCPEVFGDPAILLPKFYNPKVKINNELGIIPHYVDLNFVTSAYSFIQNVLIINPLDSLENIVNKILSCKYTISSSLHGTIVSHAYNIPSITVKFSNKLKGDGVKFKDYYASVDLPDNLVVFLSTKKKYSLKELTIMVEDSKLPDTLGEVADYLLLRCPFYRNICS